MSNWQATGCIWPILILVMTRQFGGSWCNRVGIVTSCRLDGLDSNPGRDRKCPDCYGVYPASFSRGTRVHGQGMKLTTHLHLVPRLRMSGGVPLFSYTPL